MSNNRINIGSGNKIHGNIVQSIGLGSVTVNGVIHNVATTANISVGNGDSLIDEDKWQPHEAQSPMESAALIKSNLNWEVWIYSDVIKLTLTAKTPHGTFVCVTAKWNPKNKNTTLYINDQEVFCLRLLDTIQEGVDRVENLLAGLAIMLQPLLPQGEEQ